MLLVFGVSYLIKAIYTGFQQGGIIMASKMSSDVFHWFISAGDGQA